MFPTAVSRLFLLAAIARFVLAQSLPISIPLSPPANAPQLSPALLSFSIEQDRWADWAGTTSGNSFFFNTLDNLKKRTGAAPWIRIGADSEDHTNFNPAVPFSQATFPGFSTTTPYPEASNVVVGEGYYEIVRHLPSGTHVIWGVNFGQNNLTAAVMEAEALTKAFQSSAVRDAGITLDFIEIGNEADIYLFNGLRNASTWTIAEYTKEWTTFAQNISVAAGVTPSSQVKFIGGAFGGSGHSPNSFSPQGMFATGILNSPQGKLITTGTFCSGSGGLLQDLMTKSTIRGNLTSFNADIAATRAQGLDYILGETNSYSCHGAPGVSNTAGAALWTLDYTLFASQIGISKVLFHLGVGYKYNLIQPVALTRSIIDGSPLATPLPPHVQPQYYGALIAAEAIGTSGAVRAVELTINDASIAGYAFFEGARLRRAVLINSQAFLSTNTGARGVKTVNFSFSGSGTRPATMTVKRLKIGHADDTSGLTWGGQSFETVDARPTGSLSVQTVNVSAGVAISATEAVLLTFQ